MPVFTDQTGSKVVLDKIPQRIISLVPSQTELLYDLGLNNEVVGITKFCVHPQEWLRNKTKVGGTKQIKIDIIHQLQPDLIIANKEENVKEQVEELAKYYPVWVSDVNKLEDAYEMIEQVGMLIDKSHLAKEMIDQIKSEFSRLPTTDYRLRTTDYRLPTAYFIWQKPYMTVGGDTFIHSMMEAAGFKNVFSDKKRYPEVTIDDLYIANQPAAPSLQLQRSETGGQGCQLLLLSSEPFPFKQKHVDELQSLLPNTKIMLVDGEMFSWYGSRLLKAPAYFQKIQAMLNAEC